MFPCTRLADLPECRPAPLERSGFEPDEVINLQRVMIGGIHSISALPGIAVSFIRPPPLSQGYTIAQRWQPLPPLRLAVFPAVILFSKICSAPVAVLPRDTCPFCASWRIPCFDVSVTGKGKSGRY
jgi:hypothetical protein